jgi:hypothetical protein
MRCPMNPTEAYAYIAERFGMKPEVIPFWWS